MNSEMIERTQRFLFATEDEMNDAKLPKTVQRRLLRLRDVYNYWIRFPKMVEKHIAEYIKEKYGCKSTICYEDIRLIKICLGNLNQVTKDYARYVFIQRVEEGFEIARQTNDGNAFSKILACYGKFMQLDKNEADAPAYEDIVPQQFMPVGDPSVIGLKPIENWREKAEKLKKKLIDEDSIQTEYIEIKPLEKITNDVPY